ncbi:MAG: sensor histidine kinase [Chitinophagaceae bacterium]|nr:MAG: sensor histidine kinase [Chitinophagaceae bacterium]
MVVFLPELLDYLGESFGIGKKILFNRSIAQIKLGVSQAIPIALIVNESVTNAIKYAFPAGQPGNIHISMHESAEKINLVIADDGVGIDPGILEKNTNSLGLKLLKGLTVDIDGEIEIVNENGTMIRVSFNRDQFNEFTALSSSN